MPETKTTQRTTTTLSEQALIGLIQPCIGDGPTLISHTQVMLLYNGSIEEALTAVPGIHPQTRDEYLRLRAAADKSRALLIPKTEVPNLVTIYKSRITAPPPIESDTQERELNILTAIQVGNEQLHQQRRAKRYEELLDALNPKCLMTIKDRGGGHQCAYNAVPGGKYCKRHLGVAVCVRVALSLSPVCRSTWACLLVDPRARRQPPPSLAVPAR
jgi:hypothetical protein